MYNSRTHLVGNNTVTITLKRWRMVSNLRLWQQFVVQELFQELSFIEIMEVIEYRNFISFCCILPKTKSLPSLKDFSLTALESRMALLRMDLSYS